MRGLGYLLASVVAAIAVMGGSASADIEWCAEDPIIDLLGTQFDLTTRIHSPASAVSRIVYVVEVPSNAGEVRVSFPPDDALAAVTEVRIEETGKAVEPRDREFKISASVTVTAPRGAEVILTAGGRSAEPTSEDGRANKAVRIEFTVRRGN